MKHNTLIKFDKKQGNVFKIFIKNKLWSFEITFVNKLAELKK